MLNLSNSIFKYYIIFYELRYNKTPSAVYQSLKNPQLYIYTLAITHRIIEMLLLLFSYEKLWLSMSGSQSDKVATNITHVRIFNYSGY